MSDVKVMEIGKVGSEIFVKLHVESGLIESGQVRLPAKGKLQDWVEIGRDRLPDDVNLN